MRELKLTYGAAEPVLIVVPLSTYPHWVREFERWAPRLNTVAYVGHAEDRAEIRSRELWPRCTSNHVGAYGSRL